MEKKRSPLNGLVLAGGKSVRMGIDKSAISWHGKEQQFYMAELLTPFCSEVYISRRQQQENNAGSNYKILTDTVTGIGPYGAILSAFGFEPDAAWLVVACDLPLLDTNTLSFLLENRNEDCMATTFQSPHDGLPEPLITIWEPKSHPILLSFLSAGYSCPRKVLIKSNDIHMITPPYKDALLNVNTPEDYVMAEQLFFKKQAIHGSR